MDHAQLTRKQQAFFDYVIEYRNENQVWPTYSEIADAFDYKSPNSVTQNIKALLKKGYLVKTQDDEYDLNPELKKKGLLNEPAAAGGIPIRGIIAAGYLQEAVETDLGQITLQSLFPYLDRTFALRVSGMSMKDVGIKDGDFVLLMDAELNNGDIGAILYDGETSLKRIYFDKDGLRLEPANDEYEGITIQPDIFEEVRIIGKYIGHVNKTGIHKARIN